MTLATLLKAAGVVEHSAEHCTAVAVSSVIVEELREPLEHDRHYALLCPHVTEKRSNHVTNRRRTQHHQSSQRLTQHATSPGAPPHTPQPSPGRHKDTTDGFTVYTQVPYLNVALCATKRATLHSKLQRFALHATVLQQLQWREAARVEQVLRLKRPAVMTINYDTHTQ